MAEDKKLLLLLEPIFIQQLQTLIDLVTPDLHHWDYQEPYQTHLDIGALREVPTLAGEQYIRAYFTSKSEQAIFTFAFSETKLTAHKQVAPDTVAGIFNSLVSSKRLVYPSKTSLKRNFQFF